MTPEEDLVNIWNAKCEKSGLAKVRILTKSRRDKIKRLIKEIGSLEIVEAIEKIHTSSFCLGKNDRHWKAHFDFLLQTSSCIKALEGVYDDYKPAKPFESKDNLSGPTPWETQIANIGTLVERGEGTDKDLEQWRSCALMVSRNDYHKVTLRQEALAVMAMIDREMERRAQ